MNKKHPKAKNVIAVILIVTLVFSLVYAIVNLINAPDVSASEGVRTRSDYVLMLLECCLGLAVMSIPSVLGKKWTVPIPDYMYILYFVFLYCAIYLGEVRNFYHIVPRWDVWLHGFSGGMLGCVGFIIVKQFNEAEGVSVNLGPRFVCFFALCFAVTAGVVWEIYEFTVDGLLGLNMQKFLLEDGTALAGRAALDDTMEDLIVDLIGALVAVIIGYFNISRRREDKLEKD